MIDFADSVDLRVAETKAASRTDGEWVRFEVPRIVDHELVVIEHAQ